MTAHTRERDDRQTKPEQDPARSTAERVTLGISLAILAALLGLVIYAYLSLDDRPATIEVRPLLEDVRREGDAYYLPMLITNRGGRTAEDVQVQVNLRTDQGEPASASFTIRFLAGGEATNAVVVFPQAPNGARLSTSISFLEP